MKTKEDYEHNLIKYHGFSEPNLNNKSYDELRDLYENIQKDRLENILEFMYEESGLDRHDDSSDLELASLWKRLKELYGKPEECYKFLGSIVRKFEYEDIMEILTLHVQDRIYKNIYRKLRVKFREYQEEMLSELEKICKEFPEEELYTLTKVFQLKRDDVKWLRAYIKTLKNGENTQKAKYLASMKHYTLEKYFEKSYDDEYSEYITNVKVKKELIDEIASLTKYQKSELFKKSVDDLRYIREFEVKSNDDLIRERRLLASFINRFDKVMYDSENVKFNKLLSEAKDELSEELIGQLVSYYEGKDPEFARKIKLGFSF